MKVYDFFSFPPVNIYFIICVHSCSGIVEDHYILRKLNDKTVGNRNGLQYFVPSEHLHERVIPVKRSRALHCFVSY